MLVRRVIIVFIREITIIITILTTIILRREAVTLEFFMHEIHDEFMFCKKEISVHTYIHTYVHYKCYFSLHITLSRRKGSILPLLLFLSLLFTIAMIMRCEYYSGGSFYCVIFLCFICFNGFS